MKKILFSLLAIICAFSLVGCGSKEEKKEETQEPEKQNTIGYVDEVTVDSLIDILNQVITDTSGLGPIDKETLKVNDGRYWYTIDSDIYLIVVPLNEQKDVKEDIVESVRLYFTDKTLEDPQIPAYTRLLIEANNKEITSEEAQTLIDEAKKVAEDKATSNNGKGISVGYAIASNHYEYQVIRNYKK